MNAVTLTRRCLAEALGTGLLVTAVVGSGIMAERLSGENVALALLANTIATGAALVVLILVFGPVSGAHFNPVVTLRERLEKRFSSAELLGYLGAQFAGAILGAVVANLMFDLPAVSWSSHVRTGPGEWLGECVATFGLILTIAGVSRNRPAAIPYAVAAWIVAAYWFTASTSFANPAVTVARMFSDSFAGIRPEDVPSFVLAQLAGAAGATLTARGLFGR